jgi:uncharacterized Tic20 family protein
VGYCVSCAKDVKTGKFCPECGRQLLTTAQLKAEVSSAEKEPAPLKSNSYNVIWVHLAPILGAFVTIWFFVAAFILWIPGLLIRNSTTATEFEKRHATESMNFQLTLLILTAIGTVFSIATLGFGLLVVVPAAAAIGLASLIFMIMGAVAGNDGREFRYPLSIRFVK